MRRGPGRAVAIVFLAVAVVSAPFLFSNMIQPRLGVLSADLTPTGLRIASFDATTVTFKMSLTAGNPGTTPITVPLLNFSLFLGNTYLGNGWTAQEVSVPANGQQDFAAFLTMSRTPGSPLFTLFQTFLDGASANLDLKGDAFVGGVGVPFEKTMPLGGGSSGSPSTGATDSVDFVSDFINYIQQNGVDFTNMFSTISLNATSFLEFLNKYNINLFGILYFLQEGQEWWQGFERLTPSPALSGSLTLPVTQRPGVQNAINQINANRTYTDADLASNLYTFLWNLDENTTFNGTPYSRTDDSSYMLPFTYDSSGTNEDFTYQEARFPAVEIAPKVWNETFYLTFTMYYGLSTLTSALDNFPFSSITDLYTIPAGLPIIFSDINPPMYDASNYANNTDTVWYVNAWQNYSADLSGPGTPDYNAINYMRFYFRNDSIHPVLDIQGDSNPNTFTGDYLAFYDNNTYNVSNPDASLLLKYDEDNHLIWYPGLWGDAQKTPWFETDSIRIEFVSHTHTTPKAGFDIMGIDLWHDAKFEDTPQGNFSPWALDTHSYNATHREYFNASVLPLWNAWQSDRATWDPDIIYYNSLQHPQFSTKTYSDWALLWWLQYHYDFRFLLNLFGGDETTMFTWLENTIMVSDPTVAMENQIKLMYGELELPNGTRLMDIPGYPTMSPLHEQLDFTTGGPFSAMISPMQKIWVYNQLPNGTIVRELVDYQERYGVPDAPDGAGGPYAADVSYMSRVLSQMPGWAPPSNDTFGAMFNLAMTQDSRDPNSVWQMMNRYQLNVTGSMTMDTTNWNTHPLNLIEVLQLIDQSSPTMAGLHSAQSGGGFSVISLLGGVDMMQFLNYVENHTDSSLGDVLRSLQVSTYSMLTYIIENVHPLPEDAPVAFPLTAVARNYVQGNSLLQGMVVIAPCLVLGFPSTLLDTEKKNKIGGN